MLTSLITSLNAHIAVGADATYLGAERCLDCHTRPGPLRERDGTTDWVKLTEAHTWLEIDKHSMAFDALKSERSQAMAGLLGYDVSNDDRCLSCHAGLVKGHPRPPQREIVLGVSCEACHGPSSKYDLPHTNAEWRAKSAKEKASLGMVDVRDPVQSSQQCLTCHVGNAAEGKVLTHEMYAAGHPPLPSFEAVTFARSMPPHWLRLKEKGERVRDDPKLRQISHEDAGEIPEVRLAVVGGVAALRSSLRLFAEREAASREAGGWPDFAVYDCATCHHELELPSWRQKRVTQGRPGQLLPPVWPMVLADLGERELERHDAALAKRLDGQLKAALKGGKPDVKAVTEAVDTLLPELESLTYDKASAAALLRDICQLGQRADLDFDSARQLGWAFEAIFAATYGEPISGRPKDDFTRLRQLLALDLPATRQKAILDPARERHMFDAIGDYQPGSQHAVGKLFEALSKHLPQ